MLPVSERSGDEPFLNSEVLEAVVELSVGDVDRQLLENLLKRKTLKNDEFKLLIHKAKNNNKQTPLIKRCDF